MTDLLNTREPAIHAGDEPDTKMRTFRAATLDEAVAAARTEFGRDVDLVEAHRVRRGGLGGFFSTDLGVEIVATPAVEVAEPSHDSGLPDPQGPALDPASDTDVLAVGIDRLIGEAESLDQAPTVDRTDAAIDTNPGLEPYDYELDTPAMPDEEHPFALAVEKELAAATQQATGRYDAFEKYDSFETFDTFDTFETDASDDFAAPPTDSWLDAPSTPAAPAATIESLDDEFVSMERVRTRWSGGRVPEAAPGVATPTMPTIPMPMLVGAPTMTVQGSHDMPAPARRQTHVARPQVRRPLLPSPAVSHPSTPLPPPPPASGATPPPPPPTADDLIKSLFSLGSAGEKSFRSMSVNVTTEDGTSTSVAADFAGESDG